VCRGGGRVRNAGIEWIADAVPSGLQRAEIALASRDRFFLCIKQRDPLFDREKTRQFLESLTTREVSEIEA